PKVTMFGSARTLPTDPLYAAARDLSSLLASHGWSTVTGAGPGIMAAGLEGAGPDHSFGINIRLPMEQTANEFIVSDPKLVSMKYFFTRKLLLIKESWGYVVLPGGFGTLDEAFELLTLLQTGKAEPAPVVFLELPGGTYWRAWDHFLAEQVEPRRLISPNDHSLYRVAEGVTEAAEEIVGFYRNYHSLRWVDETLVLRLQQRPTPDEVALLSEEFDDIIRRPIEILDAALPAERHRDDFPWMPRIALHFDRMSYARLRQLIDAINRLPSAPPAVKVVAESQEAD
ncbi:MAG: LOG family protein, partial [Acidimicrobiaceae bacterium]|nr:LOG family protein [Acidimicrobiaceae bacterium]